MLCDEHKDLRYVFDDVYDIVDGNPVRKEINHNAVKERG